MEGMTLKKSLNIENDVIIIKRAQPKKKKKRKKRKKKRKGEERRRWKEEREGGSVALLGWHIDADDSCQFIDGGVAEAQYTVERLRGSGLESLGDEHQRDHHSLRVSKFQRVFIALKFQTALW
jgi:hypothetical protein